MSAWVRICLAGGIRVAAIRLMDDSGSSKCCDDAGNCTNMSQQSIWREKTGRAAKESVLARTTRASLSLGKNERVYFLYNEKIKINFIFHPEEIQQLMLQDLEVCYAMGDEELCIHNIINET